MFKKITGVPANKEEARSSMVSAKETFKLYKDHLRGKKDEYYELKNEYLRERDEIKKEAKLAEQFKFTKILIQKNQLPCIGVRFS